MIDARIQIHLNTTWRNRNICHFKQTNYYLFNVKYTTFNKIYSLVSLIWKLKKFNLKTSVSSALATERVLQRRQLGAWRSTDHRKWQAKIYWQTMNLLYTFHCGLRAAVNTLRPGPLLKTVETCLTDAAASYANSGAISFLLMLYFSKRKTEFS